MPNRSIFPYHFRQVQAATPEDIRATLADFASTVPGDQEIVELGVFQGSTALSMAWGARQGNRAHVTGIDPWALPGNVYDPPFTDAKSRKWAHHWVRYLGYTKDITLIHDFSHAVAERWVTTVNEIGLGNRPVGLLYVDGDHTKEGARRDIEAWARHLAPGAVIAVDDYGHPDWPGVGQAVDELVAEGFLKPIELYHDRLAVTGLTDVIERTDPVPNVRAITSEGVEPAPEMKDFTPGIPVADPDDLASMTLGDLRKMAKGQGVRNAARMGRGELELILSKPAAG